MELLKLPRLGQTMEEGTLIEWLVKEGETFEVGDILYELETEKSTNEMEATIGGTLAKILVGEGETIVVGSELAVIATGQESVAQAVASYGRESTSEPEEEPSPAPVETSPPEVTDDPAPMRAMPRARMLAEELGVSLTSVRGTGSGETITPEDVEAVARPTGGSVDGAEDQQRVSDPERRALSGVHKAMAASVSRSWSEVPQFTQIVSADVATIMARREDLRRSQSEADVPSMTAYLLSAVSRAVREVPEVNASFDGDALLIHPALHIAVAVDSPKGLLVPVVRDADGLSIEEFASTLVALVERARSGGLAADEQSGGTLTVSNLGSSDVESGFPLVTAPQAVIVFAGSTQPRPVVVGGEVVIRPMMQLSCSFDHRVLDGATAARFTSALKAAVEAQ